MVPPLRSFREPSYRDERFVETLTDSIKFDRLLKLAETLLLKRTPNYQPPQESAHPEAELIRQLGTRGLRTALELAMNIESYQEPTLLLDENGEKDDLLIHSMSRPDFYNGPMDLQMSADVDAFGVELIREAYEVLGHDADQYVVLFRDATTDDEQLRALDWLSKRLEKLTQADKGLVEAVDGETDITYHPLRISPKALGVYPRQELSPTCLGLSLIGAGFLQRAGARYMHGGVMETERQHELLACIGLIDHILNEETTERAGVVLPDVIRERLDNKIETTFENYGLYRGTHSVLMVQLLSGEWFQIDTNYDRTMRVPEIKSTGDETGNLFNRRLTEVYDTLHEFGDIAPGLELSQQFGVLTDQEKIIESLKALQVDGAYRASVTSLIENLSDESTIEPFRELTVGLLRGSIQGDLKEQFIGDQELYDTLRIMSNGAEIFAIDEEFMSAFEEFALWRMPIDKWVKRCQEDEAFRRDRIEDIMNLPILTAIRYGYAIIDHANQHSMHTVLEFGLPERRIGMSALNNVALYFDNDLSAHHWLAQWSSQLALTDRLSHTTRSSAQAKALGNGLSEMIHTSLYYSDLYDKITMFTPEATEVATIREDDQNAKDQSEEG